MIQTTLNTLNPSVPEFLLPYVNRITAPVSIITLSYNPGGFIFDETWAKMVEGDGRPIVVLDFEEWGWDHSWKHTSIMGAYWDHRLMYGDTKERQKLFDWMSGREIMVYFKRELTSALQELLMSSIDDLFPVLPIELLSPNLPQPTEPNREEYLARSTDVFHWYGISHPDRMELHKALEGSGLRVNALEVHHTERRPLMDVMHAQSNCMASVTISGAGTKVFRLSESAWNSVPIIDDVGMEYRVKWDDSNAIMLPTENGRVKMDEAIKKIESCLADKEGMWERMKLAHENAKRMHIDNYMAEINQEIMDRL